MACDRPLETFLELIGHDGSEIVHPNLNDPWCRRTFHVQECIWAAYKLGYACTPFELSPQLAAAENYIIPVDRKFDLEIILAGKGVMMGTMPHGMRHAVGFDNGDVYDPNSRIIFDFENQDFNMAVDTIYKVDLIL